jgi:hypothetical protein
MGRLLSDEVWHRLDPYAGQLRPRTVVRLRSAAAFGVVMAIVAGLLWWSGALLPRVGWPHGAAWGSGVHPGSIEQVVVIANQGLFPVEVVGIGRSGAGLRLARVFVHFPITLEPGQRLNVVLVFEVTDCAAVTAEPWPVPVRVKRFWGTQTRYVPVPTSTSLDAPEGFRSYTGRDPYAVEWQRGLADESCRIR